RPRIVGKDLGGTTLEGLSLEVHFLYLFALRAPLGLWRPQQPGHIPGAGVPLPRPRQRGQQTAGNGEQGLAKLHLISFQGDAAIRMELSGAAIKIATTAKKRRCSLSSASA